jgi:hypothetical protein
MRRRWSHKTNRRARYLVPIFRWLQLKSCGSQALWNCSLCNTKLRQATEGAKIVSEKRGTEPTSGAMPPFPDSSAFQERLAAPVDGRGSIVGFRFFAWEMIYENKTMGHACGGDDAGEAFASRHSGSGRGRWGNMRKRIRQCGSHCMHASHPLRRAQRASSCSPVSQPLRGLYQQWKDRRSNPRPSMPPGEVILRGEKPGGGKTDFAWLVFEQGYTGEPGIGWLRREVQ